MGDYWVKIGRLVTLDLAYQANRLFSSPSPGVVVHLYKKYREEKGNQVNNLFAYKPIKQIHPWIPLYQLFEWFCSLGAKLNWLVELDFAYQTNNLFAYIPIKQIHPCISKYFTTL